MTRGMAVREFVDTEGVFWRVWSTRPSSRVALVLGYEEGWLTFESAASLRRLAPVPDAWEALGDRELERLCRTAGPVRRRVRHPGMDAADRTRPGWWNARGDTGAGSPHEG